jgi:CDP-paratose 2-epimerase
VPVIFASTNKVYGDLGDLPFAELDDRYEPVGLIARRGIDERRPLDFHTPYGCSKGAADQYVLDYARSFGIPTAVFRMSCIYGQRQMGTEDQGWVAHFLIRALEGQPITIYGDGKQVRDILDVHDAVNAYVAALRQIGRVRGNAFNLGGGPDNAVSLLQLIDEMRHVSGREVDLRFEDWRPGDQRWFVSNTHKARTALGLPSVRGWREGVARLAEWLATDRGVELQREHHLASAAE